MSIQLANDMAEHNSHFEPNEAEHLDHVVPLMAMDFEVEVDYGVLKWKQGICILVQST
jgi:hypothetical protein